MGDISEPIGSSLNDHHQESGLDERLVDSMSPQPHHKQQIQQIQHDHSTTSMVQLDRDMHSSTMHYNRPHQVLHIRHSPYAVPVPTPAVNRHNSESHISTLIKPSSGYNSIHPSNSSNTNASSSTTPGNLISPSTTSGEGNYEFILDQVTSPRYAERTESSIRRLEGKGKEISFLSHQQDHRDHPSDSFSKTILEGGSPYSNLNMEHLDMASRLEEKIASSMDHRNPKQHFSRSDIDRLLEIEFFKAKESLALRRYEVEERIKMDQKNHELQAKILQAELERTKAETERINIASNISALELATKTTQYELLTRQCDEKL